MQNVCTFGTTEPEEEEDDELTLALGVAALPSSSSSISLFLLFLIRRLKSFQLSFIIFPTPKVSLQCFSDLLKKTKTLPANPTARVETKSTVTDKSTPDTSSYKFFNCSTS